MTIFSITVAGFSRQMIRHPKIQTAQITTAHGQGGNRFTPFSISMLYTRGLYVLCCYSSATNRFATEDHRATQRFASVICRSDVTHHHHDGCARSCARHQRRSAPTAPPTAAEGRRVTHCRTRNADVIHFQAPTGVRARCCCSCTWQCSNR